VTEEQVKSLEILLVIRRTLHTILRFVVNTAVLTEEVVSTPNMQ
jgi:hypothetical protein